MELEPGTVIDRYTIDSPLGEGGMAIVYKVRHNQLGTWHALKILTLSSRSIRERLLQEGRVQAALRHPNIVAVTDVITVAGAPGLVMEYIGGPSLEQLLAKTQLTLPQAEALARGIISGVKAAHDRGLIHRDLKPANVLLDVNEAGLVPKVTDFGLSKIVSGESGLSNTRSGVAMGTPSYMSPEQIRSSRDVDHRADIFALGAILYDLACGQQAFPGDDLLEIFSKVTSGGYTPPGELVPGLPERIAAAIEGCLAIEVEQRIADCGALLTVLAGRDPADSLPSVTASLAGSGPWSGDLLSSARSLGTSSDESFQDIVSGRAAEQAREQALTQGGGSSDGLRWPDPAAAEPPASIAPSRPPTASLFGRDPRKTGAILLAVGAVLGLVGMLAIGGLAMSGALSPSADEVEPNPAISVEGAEPEAVAAAEPVAPAPVVAPEPAPAAETAPEPAAPAQPTAAGEPEPTAEPAPEPAAAPRPTVVAVGPKPSPRPAPRPKPPPEPSIAPGHGVVEITGDRENVRLVEPATMKAHFPGEVPAGTYELKLKTEDGFASLGQVSIAEGETKTLNCVAAMLACR